MIMNLYSTLRENLKFPTYLEIFLSVFHFIKEFVQFVNSFVLLLMILRKQHIFFESFQRLRNVLVYFYYGRINSVTQIKVLSK